MDPDGPSSHRQEPKEDPSHGNGGRIFTAIRGGREAGKGEPQERIPRTGNPACCPEVVIIRQQSEYPGGPDMAKGKRCSLVGEIPEALCGEAPKASQ